MPLPQGKAQTIVINGKNLYLQTFHFHTPSEHTFKGKHFPMEAYVHQSEDGTLRSSALYLNRAKITALSALTAKSESGRIRRI